ncbi:MAG: DJ-1/PfpI family protein [Nevskia sp.]|nr:DJ-1/PfpI family protein [Nevskia sp.]
MKTPTVLVPVAHGSESLEAVTIVNVLRRAELEVTVASVESELLVNGTRGLRLQADKRLLDTLGHKYDLIVLPGGERGAEALHRNAPLIEMLHQQNEGQRWFAAICAAPALTLAPHHLLDGRKATCYPAFKRKLQNFVDQPVVVDGHCVTSQGPATAMPFALKLVEILAGAAKSKEVATALLA